MSNSRPFPMYTEHKTRSFPTRFRVAEPSKAPATLRRRREAPSIVRRTRNPRRVHAFHCRERAPPTDRRTYQTPNGRRVVRRTGVRARFPNNKIRRENRSEQRETYFCNAPIDRTPSRWPRAYARKRPDVVDFIRGLNVHVG